jgi:hypothetical protein
MAIKTYRLGSGQDGNYGALFEADQTAASRTDGWTSAKIASLLAADFDAATKQASGAFVTNTTRPSTLITSTLANAFKTPVALIGTFAATAWTFSFAVRATVVSAQAGRIRMRVFKSKNADGSASTELTSATQIGTTTAVLSTTADQISTVTWNPGATIRLDNEFLFFAIAWEITTAGGSNTADVVLRTGQVSAGTRVVTPDFTANTQAFGQIALPITFNSQIDGFRIPPSAYKNTVVADSPAGYWRLDEASGAAVPVVGGITLADTATGGATTGLLPNEPTSKGRRFIAANNSYISGGVAPFKYNLFSWEFWIKRTRTDVMEDVISQYAGGISFRINTDGTLEIQQSFTGIIANTKILKLLDTNAHHVVVTRNGVGGEVNFYVDGVREIGTPQSLYSADISSWTNYAIFVGSTWGTYSFDGTFDEFAIYPTILTQAQIQNHYDIATHVPTTVFGSLDFPISFSKDVQGLRKAFGQVAFPVSFVKSVRKFAFSAPPGQAPVLLVQIAAK